MTDETKNVNSAQEAPHRVPGYSLFESLGQGGFGLVYRAVDGSPFQIPAAVKIISPHPFSDAKHTNERFVREAEAVRKLNHGGIVKYLSSGLTDDTQVPYLAMDFIEGESLRNAAAKQAFEARVDFMIQALDALEYAHSTGVLHRDIKPSNIMVRKSDGKIVIVDFGLAFLFEGISSEQFSSHYVGSIGYVPPEVMADFSHRSKTHDIFSCGITLYEILAGQRPNIQNYQPLSSVHSDLASLDPIVRQALSAEESRFKTAGEFSDRLRNWLDVAVARTKIGTNKIAELARQRLIERKNEQEQRRQELAQRQEEAQAIWEEKNAIVYPAAKLAFEQMYAAFSDVMDEYDFSEITEMDLEPAPLLVYKNRTREYRIVFGHTKNLNEPMGAQGKSSFGLLGFQPAPAQTGRPGRPMPRRSTPQGLQPPPRCLMPGWVLYTEGKSQSPRQISYGCIAIGLYPEPKLLARNIPKYSGGFALRGGPVEIQTPEEARDYVSRAIAAVFHLDV